MSGRIPNRRVVLLGDSIRQGYEPTVRAALAEDAFVWSPNDNGQHSTNLLLNAWLWVVTQQPAVLHLNAGMWDTRRVVRGEPGNVVPLPVYRDNVARLITVAQRHTPARVIWATTTPVHDEQANAWHCRVGLGGRDGSEIARYNAAAVEVARELGAAVNDLHAVVQRHGPETIRSADGVHYTEQGYAVLGAAVADAVRAELAKLD